MSDDRTAHSDVGIGRFLAFGGLFVWAVLALFHPMPAEDSPYVSVTGVPAVPTPRLASSRRQPEVRPATR